MLCNNSYACFERSDKLGPRICESALFTTFGKLDLLKVLLHCAIFSATCLAMPFVMAQVAGELHSVTGVVSQFFLLHGALHKVELLSTYRNALQKLSTPLHSVSPFQQLLLQFSSHVRCQSMRIFWYPPSWFWLPAYLGPKSGKLLEKIAQCDRAMIFSATFIATALRDKLPRKLRSVTAP